MKNFKRLFLFAGIFLCHIIKVEDKFEILEQKMKNFETLIVSIAQNMSLQQDLIHLLQKQLQINVSADEYYDEEALAEDHTNEDDHRLTLRIPKSLMAKIDIKRKQRIGKISRNLWILETLDESTRK